MDDPLLSQVNQGGAGKTSTFIDITEAPLTTRAAIGFKKTFGEDDSSLGLGFGGIGLEDDSQSIRALDPTKKAAITQHAPNKKMHISIDDSEMTKGPEGEDPNAKRREDRRKKEKESKRNDKKKKKHKSDSSSTSDEEKKKEQEKAKAASAAQPTRQSNRFNKN